MGKDIENTTSKNVLTRNVVSSMPFISIVIKNE
ncbi:hypothetical protein BD780_003776 [Clostridium tetanomorphum]|nr:hypothetical protein [Clostridium tetanomorphum]NRS86551.1 hypothetical protein [Clostridium tetanomorphum]NRZ95421.1 hypothetical protein [Clostridium tetanomorphum]